MRGRRHNAAAASDIGEFRYRSSVDLHYFRLHFISHAEDQMWLVTHDSQETEYHAILVHWWEIACYCPGWQPSERSMPMIERMLSIPVAAVNSAMNTCSGTDKAKGKHSMFTWLQSLHTTHQSRRRRCHSPERQVTHRRSQKLLTPECEHPCPNLLCRLHIVHMSQQRWRLQHNICQAPRQVLAASSKH